MARSFHWRVRDDAPTEDFAEVFGHFLHITATSQTAADFRLLPQPAQGDVSTLHEIAVARLHAAAQNVQSVNTFSNG
jgi:hypothetical protein